VCLSKSNSQREKKRQSEGRRKRGERGRGDTMIALKHQ